MEHNERKAASDTSSKLFADVEADIVAGLLRSGKPLSGTKGVLTELIKYGVEKSMDAELGEHLQTELRQLDTAARGNKRNKRNGRVTKQLNTDFGPPRIETSRDRHGHGTYSSAIVGKWQHDLPPHLSRQILSPYARGNSYEDISRHVHELFGQVLSKASI